MTDSLVYEGVLTSYSDASKGIKINVDKDKEFWFYITDSNEVSYLKSELDLVLTDKRAKLHIVYHINNEYFIVDTLEVNYVNDDKNKLLWKFKKGDKPQNQEPKKPIIDKSFGNVVLRVWKDKYNDKEVLRATIKKFYYNQNKERKETDHFSTADALFMRQALEYYIRMSE